MVDPCMQKKPLSKATTCGIGCPSASSWSKVCNLCGNGGNNNFIEFTNVTWSKVDVVDFGKGHELRFFNIATSSLFVFANSAPPTMES